MNMENGLQHPGSSPANNSWRISRSWESLHQDIISCQQCPRLVGWREQVARERRRAYRDWEYWGRPVPGFGDQQARVLVVGLAPGAHGANRTGRVFTGDGSGEFLYRALYRAGFANQPTATHREDGLNLYDLYISAVCRCAPPGNKPLPVEIGNCLPYLNREIILLPSIKGIVALGKIAFENILRLYRQSGREIPTLEFAHNRLYRLGEELPWLLASYHPSRQNTQTGRLTEAMFDEIWNRTRELLNE
jgi:uracil-DNA glycosylase